MDWKENNSNDRLFQVGFVKIGKLWKIGRLYRLLRRVFPQRCRLCRGLLNQDTIAGKRINLHGSIVVKGELFYVCHTCFILKDFKFPSDTENGLTLAKDKE